MRMSEFDKAHVGAECSAHENSLARQKRMLRNQNVIIVIQVVSTALILLGMAAIYHG